ncbi:MAG TPA: GIY-YIG nuclease family protein [Candidatus Edwardsbacteria bacterium]|nr:GIY-YIG nuclease family protein [Candidatus Edwardsbacteria bacterium]
MFYVYILASRRNGTLYIGMTNDIRRRMHEHKEKLTKGFTERYGVTRLVHLEVFPNVKDAIIREKRLKEWHRAWKIQLIEEHNPDWEDLTNKL